MGLAPSFFVRANQHSPNPEPGTPNPELPAARVQPADGSVG
jgi:hypothetical protein